MKILWITNILFPEALSIISKSQDLRSSGGWMLAAAESLLNINEDLELAVASVSPLVKGLEIVKGKKITYYVIPFGKGNKIVNRDYDRYWKEVETEYKPDIVHIHGTEFSHGYSFIKACGNRNVVISIQGMTSVICRYHHLGIKGISVIRNITPLDILTGNSLFNLQKAQAVRGSYEIEMLKSVNNIIGRTSWDKAHTWSINPRANYYFCNETLRKDFYQGKWTFDKCVPHTIFLSQAGTPIKGLHQLLKAMPLVLKHYPDTQVRIGGWNPTAATSFKQKLRLSGYGKILLTLIKKNQLNEHIHFLGNLNSEEMKMEFLKANVFVMPSTIENSPNSLGEAQLLGVPCIVAYVGGVHDMVPTPDSGDLYRFEEVEMLAYKICQAFSNSSNFDNSVMRDVARRRHDPFANAQRLSEIYKEIRNGKI